MADREIQALEAKDDAVAVEALSDAAEVDEVAVEAAPEVAKEDKLADEAVSDVAEEDEVGVKAASDVAEEDEVTKEDKLADEAESDVVEEDEVGVKAASDSDRVETTSDPVTQSPARYANALQIGTKAYADDVTSKDIINAEKSLVNALIYMYVLSIQYPAIPGGTEAVADPLFDDLEAQKDAMRSGLPEASVGKNAEMR